MRPKTPRRRFGPRVPAGEPSNARTAAPIEVFPHQLQPGDRFVDEQNVEWMLTTHVRKSVGSQDYVATVRRVDMPAVVHGGRWRGHERLWVRRP